MRPVPRLNTSIILPAPHMKNDLYLVNQLNRTSKTGSNQITEVKTLYHRSITIIFVCILASTHTHTHTHRHTHTHFHVIVVEQLSAYVAKFTENGLK